MRADKARKGYAHENFTLHLYSKNSLTQQIAKKFFVNLKKNYFS